MRLWGRETAKRRADDIELAVKAEGDARWAAVDKVDKDPDPEGGTEMADHGITQVTVVGWNSPAVTYTSPLSYDDHDGLVRIGVASTSTTPRQLVIYPQNALRSITLSFG